jgi:hypothetical protein
VNDLLENIEESGGLPTALLAVSGALFLLYLATIAALVIWSKGSRR